MRILVCGSRTWTDLNQIRTVLQGAPYGSTIVHGDCKQGADAMADTCGMMISGLHLERHPADWKTHGKSAGPLRNKEMVASKPDLVLAFWDGVSRGTGNTIALARKAKIPVHINPTSFPQK